MFPSVVVSRDSVRLSRSDPVWAPRVRARFGDVASEHFFKEFEWQLRLARHTEKYKRLWTLGCVGKFQPLKRE